MPFPSYHLFFPVRVNRALPFVVISPMVFFILLPPRYTPLIVLTYFGLFWTLCKWNHTLYLLLSFVYFAQRYICEIYPCWCTELEFVHFYGCLVFQSLNLLDDVLEPACTGSEELTVECSGLLQAGWYHVGSLKLAMNGSIYITEIGKCYKPGFSPTVVKHLPACPWIYYNAFICSTVNGRLVCFQFLPMNILTCVLVHRYSNFWSLDYPSGGKLLLGHRVCPYSIVVNNVKFSNYFHLHGTPAALRIPVTQYYCRPWNCQTFTFLPKQCSYTYVSL